MHEIFPFYPQKSESERRVRSGRDLLSALWKSTQAQPHSIERVKIG